MSYRSHVFTKGWKNLKSRNKMFNLINLMMQMLQNAYSFLITTSSLKLIIYSWDMRPCMIFYLILKNSCHRLKLSTIILSKMIYIVLYGISSEKTDLCIQITFQITFLRTYSDHSLFVLLLQLILNWFFRKHTHNQMKVVMVNSKKTL